MIARTRTYIERRFEILIATLLLGGVGISAALLVAGVALFLATGSSGYGDVTSVNALIGPDAAAAYPHSFGAILRGVVELRSFAIVELGVVVLIATPVVRVAASVLLFFAEKDQVFVAVTVAVLVLLLVSIFLLH
ncbi:MAG: DUF1634 domain-containing protein [Chloroflexota bacterium]|nr:DUF1634 domain-containing protein [Chloroflexota bacterium]